MSKYSERFKLKVVKQYLLGTDGTQAVGDRHGVPRAMVRRWVALYRIHGMDGLKKKFSHYTAQFKVSVLTHLWDNALSYGQVAAVFNIRNAAVIGQWERQYRKGGIEALHPRPRGRPGMAAQKKTPPPLNEGAKRTREEELQAENDQLRMENAYLKKLQALIQAPQKATPAKKRK